MIRVTLLCGQALSERALWRLLIFVLVGLSRFFGDFPDWSFLSFSAVDFGLLKQLQGTFLRGSATQSGPFLKVVGIDQG